MLVDHRLTPTTEAVHDTHVILCLSCEASNFLALHDRPSSFRVKQVGKDCRTMAARISKFSIPVLERDDVQRQGDLHRGYDTTIPIHLRSNRLQS